MKSRILLGDIANFSNGKISPNREDNASYEVFGSNGVIGRSEDTNAKAGTIIIGRVGSYCGSVYYSKDKCWVTDNAIKCEAKGDNVSSYLYYQAIYLKLNNFRVGSGQPLLNQGILKNLEINHIEPNIQKKIAHILSTLDDKIEINRKMNQTLEEMAQAIFKSWFVDFDPVHAKAKCSSEAELEATAKELGISKEVLDLFPSEFEESELGMIPKGWSNTNLSFICKVQSGYAFKSAWWQDTGVKVVKIKNIDGSVVNTSDCQCVSQEIADKNTNFKLNSGDCLIAMTGATVGKVGILYSSGEEYLLNQRVGRFQANEYYDEYVKILVATDKFFESIQGQAQGSAQPNISAKEIELTSVIKPSEKVIEYFSKLTKPMFSKMLEHLGEIQTLQQTRDTLLPKLLSGELDVSEINV